MLPFKNKILFVGYGAVAECTLPILFKHIKVPAKNVTVMDFADRKAKLDIHYNDTPAMTAGKPHAELKPKWKEIVKARRFTITLHLHLGKAAFRLLASDLTEGYVNYNKSE